MNRHEAIEQAANQIAIALSNKGYVNIKNSKDEPKIDALYKALALDADTAEPVAWLHHIIADEDGETDQALSFTKESFPFEGTLGYKKVSCKPLYLTPQAPTLDQEMNEYTSENCDWNDTEYLLKCAERYGRASNPSHLHCLAVALANKLIPSLPSEQLPLMQCPICENMRGVLPDGKMPECPILSRHTVIQIYKDAHEAAKEKQL